MVFLGNVNLLKKKNTKQAKENKNTKISFLPLLADSIEHVNFKTLTKQLNSCLKLPLFNSHCTTLWQKKKKEAQNKKKKKNKRAMMALKSLT